jgi:phosphatidate phosphatase APP1
MPGIFFLYSTGRRNRFFLKFNWINFCNTIKMQNWKNKLLQAAITIDAVADKCIDKLKHRLGTYDAVQIVPYRTYGTPYKIYIRGRVLEDKKITKAKDGDRMIDNLLNMYKRFESDEVSRAKLQLQLGNKYYTVITDKEGYFVFDINPDEPLINDALYYVLPLTLIDAPIPFSPVTVDAEMMIPPADAEYGIISDIDDTIIQTGAVNMLAMGKTVLLGNARTRLPFAGVAEFYKALQLGRNGKRNNPFFYVSSSPWNMYDLLTDFMDFNDIPAGPVLLRDFGLNESFISGDYMGHKFETIAQILDTYPKLNFVLAGDSGEQDPPIYYEVVKRYPGRIISIYIRDVAAGKKQQIAKDIVIDLQKEGVEMMLVENSVNAAEHAAAAGLIFKEHIPAIEKDKKQDEGNDEGKVEAGL